MGKNLALNADITASSYVDPYEPGRAVNGIVSDPTSRWLCAALPGWLRLDLNKSCWIGEWTVKSISGYAGWPADYRMTSFSLERSIDGTNWITVDSVTSNTYNVCTRVLASPVYARYFRLFVPNNGGLQANKSAASVMELELVETEVDVLTSLVIKDKEEHTALLTPAFHPDTLSYTSNVGYDSDCITVIPVASKTTAAITVNGQELIGGKASVAMTSGLNNVEIKVTSAVGYTVTYMVTVTRASSPYLASVTMTGFRIPGFSKTTYSYNLTTRNLASTKVTPTPEDQEAVVIISLNGTTFNSGQAISLIKGLNPIKIVVASKTGFDSRTYIFNINKTS
ncbi:cadherin-like protein [Lacrimispora xylanisolvens]|uniref:Cadherin-like protein n=1 Tax=Lacrimispora xylanisolvens TaxID=384636 RepID=A0A2S6HZH6_9FIRM|nr:cadherin-like beta sandwich domain-containing protein [Hungatella xylanolytica]PPK83553.1 cadherin-like protein [Hungatella xylanolytica]